MIYFTADTHFNHPLIISYCGRPFADLEEMTETLIDNWNQCVKPGDTVYHLGDFALTWNRRDGGVVDLLLSRLNGEKHLIKGNHDREPVSKSKRWVTVSDYRELKVDTGGERRQKIVLCHYAMRVWNGSHRGSWMLYGHSHGNLVDIGGKTMDVGVDANNYRPISITEVAELMRDRAIVEVDHHAVDSAE